MKKKNDVNNSQFFWSTAKDYLNHYLTNIRKSSVNTVSPYRHALNYFIDYLVHEKLYNRKEISFQVFNRTNIKDYMSWILNKKNLSPKTCNLRLTAIHALMEYASQESLELMSYYMEVCTVKAVKTQKKPIEYFNNIEMAALLSSPAVTEKASERRNQMMLILLYDTAARVSEILDVKIRDIHLNVKPSYVTVCGKGRKYRNIPLMEKNKKTSLQLS